MPEEKVIDQIAVSDDQKIVIKEVGKKIDVRFMFLNDNLEWQFGKGLRFPAEHKERIAKAILDCQN